LAQSNQFNAQYQQRIAWPASTIVARAYVDQLNRSNGIKAERAHAVTDVLARADKVQSRRQRGAAALAGELNAVAGRLESDAGAAAGPDAVRLRLLAANVKEHAAKLR